MISRTLVPMDVRPLSAAPETKPPRRLSSALDDRIVVTRDMAVKPLDTRTSIPSHVPLGVLTTRTLVPRDMPIRPLEAVPEFPDYLPLDILESRIVVPRDVDPVEEIQETESRLFEEVHPLSPEEEEVLEPDLLTTGEVNLLNRPVDERGLDWRSISRVGSICVHILVLILAFFSAAIFPHHEPTAEDEALARQQLNFIYLPPSVTEPPKPHAPSPNIKIAPDTIRRVAPPTQPPPGPVANNFSPTPQPELPSAPVPQPSTNAAPPSAQPSAPVSHNPASLPDSPKPSLTIPDMTPGRALQQSVQQALKNGPTAGTRGFEDRVSPRSGGVGGGGGGGQGGSARAQLDGNIEMLTPTDGVDFNDYFNRLLASVRRNWYAIIPESARLGDRGRVVIQFHINRDGSVPSLEPVLVRTSSKEPLDRAAMAAIHASNPFEPLPSAYTRPAIEIRFTFLYNLPLDAQ
jgi:TonB family protein